MKKTILTFSRLPSLLLDPLRERYEVVSPHAQQGDVGVQFAEALPRAQGLIGAGKTLGEAQLAKAARLEVISSVSVGYDNYDVEYLTRRGILLTNTPKVLTETTADLGFSLLLAVARRIPELDAWVKAGQWRRTLGEAHFASDVHGKTLGIVGLGEIGSAIARRGHFGFNMPILYSGNTPKPALEAELGAHFVSLDALMANADFVCVVAPLTPQTRHLIGARELELMKPEAFLINISRGPLVDEQALIQALQLGRIRGAGLDVYTQEPLSQSPLFALPQVVTLPHAGSATTETRLAMAQRALANLLAALEGHRPQDLVNPRAWKPA